MKISNISNMDEIVRTFNLIQAKFPTAVIAGGAVRDLIFTKEIKDIDIFVQDPKFSSHPVFAPTEHAKDVTTDNTFWWHLMKMSNTSNPRSSYYTDSGDRINRIYDGNRASALADGRHITAVFSGHKNTIKYDIILTRELPEVHVNKYFDIGLCKAYFNGKRFRYTADFMRDQQNKTFTVLGQDMNKDDFKRTVEIHIPRIQYKYPGFKTVIAPHNKQFVDK